VVGGKDGTGSSRGLEGGGELEEKKGKRQRNANELERGQIFQPLRSLLLFTSTKYVFIFKLFLN
jgi:hypothetical protein